MHEPQWSTGRRLTADALTGTPRAMARQLLGQTLVRKLPSGEMLRGTIVEVEAYLARRDPASHSHRGPTGKNRSMFGPPGTLYVYPIHSRHCLNIVTEPAGTGSAILIRALEPFEGWFHMAAARRAPPLQDSAIRWPGWSRHLCSGPARLCQAMSIDRDQDGLDLTTSDQVWLEEPPLEIQTRRFRVRQGPRIGISQAQALPLRYFIDGHHCVSGCARDHSRGRYWTFLQPGE
ncbi:MAG: DNA-3-methyladenine glycosylase [Planctomycetota bacterium]|nr:MAG: DNA-3-methyladenine glycosylase [Planctomycetota bacterium]